MSAVIAKKCFQADKNVLSFLAFFLSRYFWERDIVCDFIKNLSS